VEETRNLSDALARLNESLSSSFSQLTNEQKRFARLQHQQLSALFLMQQNAQSGSSNGNRSDVKDHFDQDRTLESLSNLDEIYANFQRQSRGDFNLVKESLRVYLPLLSETAIKEGILDLGCGRGEWLQLLQEAGLQARGIESNRVLATQARGRNLEVIDSDALVYLRHLPENSLNAVTAFHFIEHVGFEELIELLSEIRRTLTPGGLLIIETPNPKNLVVGACNFYSDPTHRQPVFPETLEFLIQQFRFARARIRYLHPVEASPFTGSDAAQQALNSWFFSGRDYSLVGWKS
jgi:SAM-dependent methyltransferase